MRRSFSQLSLFCVALLIGLLLVGQLRSQARPTEISSLPAQDLSTLIETLSARNRELRAGLADTQRQLQQYRQAQTEGQSLLSVSTQDLQRITAFAGTRGVQGQGLVIDVAGMLDAVAVNDLINELRNAGAEAIAIDGTRVTARSVAVQARSAIQIDGVPIGERFSIRAVGDPDGLLSALQRPGGTIAQLRQFIKATIDARQAAQIELPPTRLNLTPTVAKPVE
ncbi:MAG: DUF881 domain-containing protein [Candidatus Limnocylindria bacterium]